MQIKIFTIPVNGGEAQLAELNTFLRSKNVLQVVEHIVTDNAIVYWSFCVKYLELSKKTSYTKTRKERVDYKEVLDAKAFERFSKMREIRRNIAKEEGIPAYAIFLDEELAKLAKMEQLDKKAMQSIEGIGAKKIEKYGQYFYNKKQKTKIECGM